MREKRAIKKEISFLRRKVKEDRHEGKFTWLQGLEFVAYGILYLTNYNHYICT